MVVRFVVILGPICCDDNMQHFAVLFVNCGRFPNIRGGCGLLASVILFD